MNNDSTINPTVGDTSATVTSHDVFLAPPGEMAVRDARSHLRFWGVAAGVLALDLWSKAWAFRALDLHEARTIVPHVLEFHRSMNDGAVFGSFTGRVTVFMVASLLAMLFVFYLFATCHRRGWWLHVAFGLIIAGALGNLYDRAFVRADVAKVQSSGGQVHTYIGTVIGDRDGPWLQLGSWPDGSNPEVFSRDDVLILRHQGVVRDFIKFVPVFPGWVPWLGGTDVWPWVFNVADAGLVCGVIVMMLHTLFFHRGSQRRPSRGDGVTKQEN